jgi:hypothetical protein
MRILPPYLIDMRVHSASGRPVHLWLPIFLLWPFVLVIVVLALVLTILADVVLAVFGRPYHHYTMFLLGVFQLTAELHGTTIHINGPDALVDLTIK